MPDWDGPGWSTLNIQTLQKERGKQKSESGKKEIPVIENHDLSLIEFEEPDKQMTERCDQILKTAIGNKASDIQISVTNRNIKFKIDGRSKDIAYFMAGTSDEDRTKCLQEMVNCFHCLAKMSYQKDSRKGRPKDGHFFRKFSVQEGDGWIIQRFDFRTASIATGLGDEEHLTIRILDQTKYDLNILGFSPNTLSELERLSSLYNSGGGGFWITGRTGSGKTTTIYSVLKKIYVDFDGGVDIFTIEDPIECIISGLNQIQVNYAIKLFPADILRSLLRKAPDIIMVQEIRDYDTAEIALRAANTGHLVLGTMHTDHAVQVFSRFRDINIDPHSLLTTTKGVMAQRLLPKLCFCKQVDTDSTDLDAMGIPLDKDDFQNFPDGQPFCFFKPRKEGCPACKGRGHGRLTLN